MDDQQLQTHIFSKEQINNIVGFFITLKRIHQRLLDEGYTIKKHKIIPPKIKKPLISCRK